jgi:tripartite-type tricarboxylate transporter receptor subunit TctC
MTTRSTRFGKHVLLFIAAAALALASLALHAAEGAWPTRTISLIVPYNAGATPDIIARLVAPKLQTVLGQPIVVINKTGAGSNIGTRAVLTAPSDGYTLGIVGNPQTIHHLVSKEPAYNFAKQVTPITDAAAGYYALVVNPERLNVKSVGELIAQAKAHPGKLQYGSGGIATSPHLVGEWFKSVANVDILHVPYSGTTAQNTALLRGEVDMVFTSPIYVAEQVKAGKLRVLAVTLPERDKLFFPSAPTLKESGVDLAYTYWIGFVGPSGMPDAITQRLNREIVAILKSPEIGEAMRQAGLSVVADTPAEFKATIDRETTIMTKVIQAAKIEPQ